MILGVGSVSGKKTTIESEWTEARMAAIIDRSDHSAADNIIICLFFDSLILFVSCTSVSLNFLFQIYFVCDLNEIKDLKYEKNSVIKWNKKENKHKKRKYFKYSGKNILKHKTKKLFIVQRKKWLIEYIIKSEYSDCDIIVSVKVICDT